MTTPRSTMSRLIGLALVAPGALLGLWVVTAMFSTELAFDGAYWYAQHSPFELTVPPVQFANDMIQPRNRTSYGLLALLLCWIGLSNLGLLGRGAALALDLKTTDARVGRPLEGSLLLASAPKPDDGYDVRLACTQSQGSGKNRRVITAFEARLEARPVQRVEGWSVPFKFDIPATAPPTGTPGLFKPQPFDWHLSVYRTNTWISFPTSFPIELAAAPSEELRALEATESPEQRGTIQAIERATRAPLLPHQRARLRSLSRDDLATARRATEANDRAASWLLGRLMLFFFVVPVVVVLVVYVIVALVTK